MKYIRTLFFILLIPFLFSCNAAKKTNDANSQETSNQRQRPPRGGGERGDMAERQAALIDKMNLSTEQATKFKAINQKYLQQMQALRENNPGDRQAMMEKMRPLRENQNKEVQSILSSEQYEIYLAETQKQRGRRRG